MTYALAIYLLNQFIGFLSPKFDPEMEEALMEDGEISILPSLLDSHNNLLSLIDDSNLLWSGLCQSL